MIKIKQQDKKNYGGVRFSSGTYSNKIGFKKIKNLKKIILSFLILILFICTFWFNKNVLQGLPDVSQLNDMVFSESTVIQDRNGVELYKIFEENREYVPLESMSPNMINAIVAMEDQRYREHGGLDSIGILRAAVNNFFRPGTAMQGASTISQQLLKNVLLNQEFKRESLQDKIVRKFREVLLVGKLNNVLEKEIRKENGSIKKDQLHKEMKNKTLELYLNYISFGNNAFGVEAASKTYFSKSAKDLDILESSILASIPKSPTIYNPYRNRDRVLGNIIILDQYGVEVEKTQDLIDQVVARLARNLENANITQNGSFTKTLDSITTFTLSNEEGTYSIKYNIGRKDSALMRMYDDGYITQNELKQSFLQGITYALRRNRIDILAPHFVHWVIEELEKTYDKDTLTKGGIIVTTTLDLDMQKIAEESLSNNVAILQENGANNSSMVYLDSQNGDVLAYVGSINYFDENIQGQNDMVRRPRQSGSSVKPFIYSLAFEKLPLTLDTPIFDIPFKIGQDEPSNAEGKFSGLLPLRLALGHSRNIPATKVILALGGEAVAKPYLKDLGMLSIKDNVEYGYPLALGAAEVTMLELANAYSHLSFDNPAEINPILEIRSRDGSLIYKKEKKEQKNIIPAGIRYLMWNILSEPVNRLGAWATRFNVQGLMLGIKTGTSNVKMDRGNRPRDGWLAAYNGSKVAVFWAGNANGNPMNRNAFGGTIHANPMRNFFTSLVRNNYITNDTIRPIDTTTVDISKISGRLANENTPSEFVVNTLRYIYGIALESDIGATPFEYDILCNGAQSPVTPLDSLYKGYFIKPISMMPNNMDLNEITNRFNVGSSFTGQIPEGGFVSGDITYNYPNLFLELPIDPCKERGIQEDESIKIDIISPNTNGSVSNKFTFWHNVYAERGVKSVVVFADNKQIAHFSYNGRDKSVSELNNISSSLSKGEHNIDVMVIDVKGYSNKLTFPLDVVVLDNTPPFLLENKSRVQIQDNGKYQINLIIEDDLSFIEYGKISVGTSTILEFKGNVASFILDQIVPVDIIAKDAYGNILEKTVDLSSFIL